LGKTITPALKRGPPKRETERSKNPERRGNRAPTKKGAEARPQYSKGAGPTRGYPHICGPENSPQTQRAPKNLNGEGC